MMFNRFSTKERTTSNFPTEANVKAFRQRETLAKSRKAAFEIDIRQRWESAHGKQWPGFPWL